MASTGGAAAGAERSRRLPAARGSSVRAVATVLVTAGICWLSTVVLKTGDVPITVRLWVTLDHLREAQRIFAESCGRGSYAASIDQLLIVLDLSSISGDPPFLLEARADLPGRLAGVEIALGPAAGAAAGPSDCRNRPTTTQFYASATLRRSYWHGPSFAMGTDGVIWQSATAEPPREPFGSPATLFGK